MGVYGLQRNLLLFLLSGETSLTSGMAMLWEPSRVRISPTLTILRPGKGVSLRGRKTRLGMRAPGSRGCCRNIKYGHPRHTLPPFNNRVGRFFTRHRRLDGVAGCKGLRRGPAHAHVAGGAGRFRPRLPNPIIMIPWSFRALPIWSADGTMIFSLKLNLETSSYAPPDYFVHWPMG